VIARLTPEASTTGAPAVPQRQHRTRRRRDTAVPAAVNRGERDAAYLPPRASGARRHRGHGSVPAGQRRVMSWGGRDMTSAPDMSSPGAVSGSCHAMSMTSRCPLSSPAPARVVIAGVPAPPARRRRRQAWPWQRSRQSRRPRC